MDVKETQSNIDIENVLTVFPPENKDLFTDSRTTIFPILGGGERLGTLVLGRVLYLILKYLNVPRHLGLGR